MAKNNQGDILTCDWNPVIGCERYSAACKKCWYLDGIFPWQQRLGNIPESVKPNQAWVFSKRMQSDYLKTKNGIVGVCQHGDLFWDGISEETINQVLSIIEQTAEMKKKTPMYLLWTKRAERMSAVLGRRYPRGLPRYLACAVSIEDQSAADKRLPYLASIEGIRIAVCEPLLAPVSLGRVISRIDWVIVGSETGGEDARPIDLDWVRDLKEETKDAKKPFFVKQLGMRHDEDNRSLDGRLWNEFPSGFVK